MNPIAYAGYQFPPTVIQHAVWLYFRFNRSLRDVEDFLAERGFDVSYETIRRWVARFGTAYPSPAIGVIAVSFNVGREQWASQRYDPRHGRPGKTASWNGSSGPSFLGPMRHGRTKHARF